MPFELTARQHTGLATLASAPDVMLFGGSRSGKTFLILFAIIARALKAPGSRHAVLRFAFNHLISSIIADTWPKVVALAYPGLEANINRQAWFARLPNESEVWFGGLDDKERTEKILGQEHSTIYLNECSQIAHSSRLLALTRLAQRVEYTDRNGKGQLLPLRAWYDCNPPTDSHWSCKIFQRGIDPDTGTGLDRSQFASLQMNPRDNTDNLAPEYIKRLESMPARMRKRFLDGEFGSSTEGALWTLEGIDRNRADELPDLQRIVIGVDPSGADDTDNASNDEIGICVCGLGIDGRAYVLEDCTLKAGPGTWGRVVGTAFDRHAADLVVGEANFGGAMVKHTIQVSRPGTPYKPVNAARGKVVRAEPISALYEQGKVKHAGRFDRLEDEMCAMTTHGYSGEGSPNRVDALVWALTELFPAVTRKDRPVTKQRTYEPYRGEAAWMA
jgi:hypothetical protein